MYEPFIEWDFFWNHYYVSLQNDIVVKRVYIRTFNIQPESVYNHKSLSSDKIRSDHSSDIQRGLRALIIECFYE